MPSGASTSLIGMNPDHSPTRSLTVLGLGAMGTALAEAWLSAGYAVTVWNRTPARAEPLLAKGATVAATAAAAVAANQLVVICLLDHASVDEALADTDPAGRDLVDLTTALPPGHGTGPPGRSGAVPASWTAGSWPCRR
ncbi:hypothetical protein GCM10028832_44600 [Streptomyces sparsus]